MRFYLVANDVDVLLNMVTRKQRDQAAIEAIDAERQQTAKRRDAMLVAAAWTKPHGSIANDHDPRESVQAAGVKA